MNVIVNDISKSFKEETVIDSISFSLEPGNIIGLLGPYGAGKTTTLRMLLNIFPPDSGEILFDDEKSNKKIRRKIGYLPEDSGIYERYKVIDVLNYLGRLKGISKRKCHVEIVRLLDRFNLIDLLEEPVKNLSLGQQKIVQYIASYLHEPELLLLDEPFTGLDPINQEIFIDHINTLKEEGKTILISTYLLIQAEQICNSFLFLNEGKIVLQGDLEEISKHQPDDILYVSSYENLALLKEVNNVSILEIENNVAKLKLDSGVKLRRILEEIINTVNITRIELKKPNLKEVFLSTIKDNQE